MAKSKSTKKEITEKIEATHLVLSCMDHRCTDDVVHQIHKIIDEEEYPHVNERYDHLIVAGGSLGVVQKTFPAWGEAFWQQLFVARLLHPKIETIILLDHLECGAFRNFFPGYDGTVSAHDEVTKLLSDEILRRLKGVTVERWVLVPDRTKHRWEPKRLG